MVTSSNRVLLLYTSAGGGHRAAAAAVAESLRAFDPGADVEVRDVLEFAPRWFKYDRAWSLIQTGSRRGWDWVFDQTDRDGAGAIDGLRLPIHRALFRDLNEFLVATPFTHIVTTHYLPAISVARLRRNGMLAARAITTVTDHITHRAWVTPGIDGYCVADPAVARAMIRRAPGVPVQVTGIPISRATAAPVRPVAARLDVPGALVLLGGVEEGDAIATIDSLAPMIRGGRLRARILCGGSSRVLSAARRRLAGSGAEVADKLPGLLAAVDEADVVVTKAGGLVTSECLARGRPLVLPYAAPGQERGNLFYALDCGAAARPNEIADTGALIANLASEPGRLRRMGESARSASRPHAADDVVRFLLSSAATTTTVSLAA